MSKDPSPSTEPTLPARIASVDTYRGAVMFLMMAEVLRLSKVAQSFPESPVWQALSFHQSHVAWRGCSVHDMIQPSFTFLVGVALPFSLASRIRRGDSMGKSIFHAAWRALILIALGIFLRSMGRDQTNYTFEDTLTQIGLGYLPLFLIGLARPWVRWAALAVILVGYWGAFAAYPVPGPEYDYSAVGVPADWQHHETGLAAHWNKNSNLASRFDQWFLNLFPREKPFTHNGGGYSTLSFIPTLATMLLGLIAGGWLRGEGRSGGKLGRMLLAAVVCVAAGWALDHYGLCPNVKRIWTPSWVLFSGGIAFAVLALLYATIDLTGFTAWTYPLRVIGRNSIAAYCIAHLLDDFVLGSIKTHLGRDVFAVFGPTYEPLVAGASILGVYWLILFWMDRRGIYLRV
ncbi:acyltransferase family protein (plasmid) [Tundrisphaera lichenicola]|uniref:acyltransferase family protein n=1 Tax=Tundrisphaera lichenicola TaxID=2029860 RepID=UPI003EB6ECB7